MTSQFGVPSTVNAQLQEMFNKLQTKMKREVQQRIESQRKIHAHLHATGEALQQKLINVFEEEMGELQAQVQVVESSLDGWEPDLLNSLTTNNQRVKSFETECTDAFNVMRNSL